MYSCVLRIKIIPYSCQCMVQQQPSVCAQIWCVTVHVYSVVLQTVHVFFGWLWNGRYFWSKASEAESATRRSATRYLTFKIFCKDLFWSMPTISSGQVSRGVAMIVGMQNIHHQVRIVYHNYGTLEVDPCNSLDKCRCLSHRYQTTSWINGDKNLSVLYRKYFIFSLGNSLKIYTVVINTVWTWVIEVLWKTIISSFLTILFLRWLERIKAAFILFHASRNNRVSYFLSYDRKTMIFQLFNINL